MSAAVPGDVTVEACGRAWVVASEPSVDGLLRFRDWVAEQEGDVFADLEQAIKYGLPEGVRVSLFKAAKDRKEELRCFGPGCELFTRHLRSPAGAMKYHEILLRERYPDVTAREAAAVFLAYADRLDAEKKAREGNGKAPAPQKAATGATA